MDAADLTFGQWLQRRRQALHLTQQQLGHLAGCSTALIRKLEADERRPSSDVAQGLAAALQLPAADRRAFLRFARGESWSGPDVAVPPVPAARPLLAPTNLALPPTPLLGRSEEVQRVRALLERDDVRLVTLTGPGGVGKTHLSLAVAEALRATFVDGVYVVQLAPISDPALVLPTIAQTLEVKETGSQPLLATVQMHLRDKHLLLLLDNFEQVVAAGLQVADLLGSAPWLKVLITSRMPLHLRGEREAAVAPLAVPTPGHRDPEALTQYAAVQLFIARAQAVKADFQVTNANAPAVAEICVRLDGLPLAVELAAARSKLLPPDALLQRLSHRLKLLRGGQRDLPARQQTLRAAIDWSYDLLDPPEQTLFARLAVFVGGSTVDAVEAVCTADGELVLDVLDGLQSLVDKSLLQQAAPEASTPRFTMLETIREYALERLEASGAGERLRQHHAAYFFALVQAYAQEGGYLDTAAWLAQLDADHDNVRAALRWATERDPSTAVRMAAGLKDFWGFRGFWREGQHWIEPILPLGDQVDARMRSRLWDCAGSLAHCLEDPRALPRFEQALVHAREAGFVAGEGFALRNIGVQWWKQGEHARALALFEESLALYRQIGHQAGIGILLHTLGQAWERQDPARAEAYYHESLAIFRALEDQGHLTGVVLTNLAKLALRRGELVQAEQYAGESLALARAQGTPYEMVDTLYILGTVARRRGEVAHARRYYWECLERAREWGEPEGIITALVGVRDLALARMEQADDRLRAARLGGAVEGLREALTVPGAAEDQAEYAPALEAAREEGNAQAWSAAWAAGRAMSLEQGLAYAVDSVATFP